MVGQQDYSPYLNVTKISPNILMESESHHSSQIEESTKLMKKLGGKVIVMPYFKEQSSSMIKSKLSII